MRHAHARSFLLLLGALGCADPGTLGGADGVQEATADAQPADAQPTDASVAMAPDAAEAADMADALDARLQPEPQPEPQPDAPPEPGPAPGDGCGRALAAGVSAAAYDHAGAPRSFRMFVPSGYDPRRPTPVVIDLHGRHGSAAGQALLSNLDAVAEANGFVVVQPQGEGGDATWNAGLCCGGAQQAEVDDVGAIAALLDHLEAIACVDADRVFATGISNGGFMAHRLACALSDRIAAIAPVAGGNLMLVCAPERPVAVFHFHGLDDFVVPYAGFGGFASIPDSTAAWATRNGCDAAPAVFFDEADVRCERWSSCDAGATVQLCAVEGGGHTWPGGPDLIGLGATTRTISASAMMWSFFEAHPRR